RARGGGEAQGSRLGARGQRLGAGGSVGAEAAHRPTDGGLAMNAPSSWALKLGGKPPLEWTDAHERVLRDSDTLWDDLRWEWIRARQLQEAAEDATGDADLLAARAAYREAEERVDAAF